jgi:poly(3-hydroxybutyrate) depolymerase
LIALVVGIGLQMTFAAAAGWATVSLVSLRCQYAPALRLYARAGFVSTQERHYTGAGALGEWAFDVAWLTLDLRAAWAGRNGLREMCEGGRTRGGGGGVWRVAGGTA